MKSPVKFGGQTFLPTRGGARKFGATFRENTREISGQSFLISGLFFFFFGNFIHQKADVKIIAHNPYSCIPNSAWGLVARGASAMINFFMASLVRSALKKKLGESNLTSKPVKLCYFEESAGVCSPKTALSASNSAKSRRVMHKLLHTFLYTKNM